MNPASADTVAYQPRHRSRWWPDVLVALVLLAVPVVMFGGEFTRANVRSSLESTAVICFMMGLLLPWFPAAWSWFRLAPALGRVVERDFRLDLALTLRTPREVLAGELARRAVFSTLPALALVLVVVAGAACVTSVLDDEELALILLIWGFCLVVATPVMLLVGWATLSIIARRRLAAGSAGWLSWSMIQLIVATVYLVLATYVLEFGVIMMLVFVAMLVERLGDPTELLPVFVMLIALVIVTITIVAGLGWVIVGNLRSMARDLWSFDSTPHARPFPTAGSASVPAQPPVPLAWFARLRWLLAAAAIPLIVLEGVGLSFAITTEGATIPEEFFFLSGLTAGLLLALAAYDLRLVLARLRLSEPTRHARATTALMIAIAQASPWLVVATTMIGLSPALAGAGWKLAHANVLSFDPLRNWDVLLGLMLGAGWLAMAVATLALVDATKALDQPPTRPSAVAIALRVVGYPAALGIGLMFAVAILMAPTMSVGFAGNGPSERLTAMLALGVWGGVVLCAMAAVTGWAAWRWMRAWKASQQEAAMATDP